LSRLHEGLSLYAQGPVTTTSAANNRTYHVPSASLAQAVVNRFDDLAVIERAD